MPQYARALQYACFLSDEKYRYEIMIDNIHSGLQQEITFNFQFHLPSGILGPSDIHCQREHTEETYTSEQEFLSSV